MNIEELNYQNKSYERFLRKIKLNKNGCCVFGHNLNKNGYAMFKIGRPTKWRSAHRYSYEVHKGQIPNGLTIDHLCSVRNCVNPEHLRAVTLQENIRAGGSIRALERYRSKMTLSERQEKMRSIQKIAVQLRASKTHCRNGHLYTPENTKSDKNHHRLCIECSRKSGRESMRRRRAALRNRG